MNEFVAGCIIVWAVLVSFIYPLLLFKRLRAVRDQLDGLSRKLTSTKRELLTRHEEPSFKHELTTSVTESPASEPESLDLATSAPVSVPPPLPKPTPTIPEESDMKFDLDPTPGFEHPIAPLPPLPSPVSDSPMPVDHLYEPSAFELAAKGVVSRIWNWILVGEDYRKPGVSVEFTVATNWLVRVGVLILVVGVGFFLDYSARMGWLGDAGKVALSGILGAGLVGWGMSNLNKKYHLLGQGLIGAGFAILYTTMFAAHQRYELISPVVAFVGMFLVTLGAVGISVFSRSLLIAVLGIIGGYITPFLLPDSGDVLGLLVYVAGLGSGVLLISIRRQWFVLNVMAFLFTTLHTVAILSGWGDPVSFKLMMPFLVLYFLIFSTSAFLFQVLRNEKSTWLDLGFLLTNAGVFFLSARELILVDYTSKGVAWVALFLAGFYAGHLCVFMKRKGEDKGLALSFMGLTSLFLMLTVPLYFSSDWWTLSWSILALVLLVGSQKVNSRFLEQVAFGIFSMSLLRFLFLDTFSVYGDPIRPGMPLGEYASELVRRFMQMGVPLLSVAAANWSQQHPLIPWPEFQVGDPNDSGSVVDVLPMRWIFRGLLCGLVFFILQLEIFRSFSYLFEPVVPVLLTLVWVGTGWFLMKWMREHPAVDTLQVLVVGFSLALIGKWLFWDLSDWGLLADRGRFASYSFLDAGIRFLDFILRTGFLIYGAFAFRDSSEKCRNYFGYAALGSLWIYSTLEVNSLLFTFVPGLCSGGLSVFWGVFALSLVSVGLVKRYRPLRLIGLGLFGWVALKVFFHDLASLDPIYKIVAFILLGMVLLAAAFAYVRFQDRFGLGRDQDSDISPSS